MSEEHADEARAAILRRIADTRSWHLLEVCKETITIAATGRVPLPQNFQYIQAQGAVTAHPPAEGSPAWKALKEALVMSLLDWVDAGEFHRVSLEYGNGRMQEILDLPPLDQVLRGEVPFTVGREGVSFEPLSYGFEERFGAWTLEPRGEVGTTFSSSYAALVLWSRRMLPALKVPSLEAFVRRLHRLGGDPDVFFAVVRSALHGRARFCEYMDMTDEALMRSLHDDQLNI